MQIIHENEYEEIMKNIVTPYLLSHRRELYVPGADYPFRNESKRITGKIHMLQYLSDIDMPKGVVVISHGFTESAYPHCPEAPDWKGASLFPCRCPVLYNPW